MNNDNTLPKKKLHLLGNILLVLASLGLLIGLVIFPLSFSLSTPEEYPAEFNRMTDEVTIEAYKELYPDLQGISGNTTVFELLERDRTFFQENRGMYLSLSAISAAFMILYAFIFLRLALAWRRAEPFGRVSIIGLRCLGALLIAQFAIGLLVNFFIPRAGHRALFLDSEVYEEPIMFLMGGGPLLLSGILFLILSWVLDYGRRINEEQSLTI